MLPGLAAWRAQAWETPRQILGDLFTLPEEITFPVLSGTRGKGAGRGRAAVLRGAVSAGRGQPCE